MACGRDLNEFLTVEDVFRNKRFPCLCTLCGVDVQPDFRQTHVEWHDRNGY